MDSLQAKAILAGVLFGLWPLLMNRSGLSGNISSLVFAAGVLGCVSLVAIRDIAGTPQDFTQASWAMAAAACLTGGVGIIAFNGMLAKASPQSVGALFVLMIVVQTTVPAAYSVIMNGGISLSKAVGFVLAAASAVLLTRT